MLQHTFMSSSACYAPLHSLIQLHVCRLHRSAACCSSVSSCHHNSPLCMLKLSGLHFAWWLDAWCRWLCYTVNQAGLPHAYWPASMSALVAPSVIERLLRSSNCAVLLHQQLLLSLVWSGAVSCWLRGLLPFSLLSSGFSSVCTLPGSAAVASSRRWCFTCNHDTEEQPTGHPSSTQRGRQPQCSAWLTMC